MNRTTANGQSFCKRDLARKVATRLIVCLLAFAAGPAAAHFSEGTKVRTIVLATGDAGLVAHVRVPAPLLFADRVVASMEAQEPFAAPFVRPEPVGGGLRYRLDMTAIERDVAQIEARLADALIWQQNGRPVGANLTEFRIALRDPVEGFRSPEEAAASVSSPGAGIDPVFGDAFVEYTLTLDAPMPRAPLSVRSAYPPLPLPRGVSVDNHLVDARGPTPVSLSVPGQLAEPVTLDGSAMSAFVGFVWQGVLHILKGLDHVLLVVCLALGAGSSRRLLWLVTAFTLGHAATLAVSFLGYVPDRHWFIPAVEAAIAATVVYAAVAAWMRRLEAVWIIGAVGLLHGLGFSFVLSEILGRDADRLIPALAAFTLGIELGQLAIVLATLATVAAISLGSRRVAGLARSAVLTGIALAACFWLVERASVLS